MPRILSVKNLERYQHYRDRNPPWIKLHKSLYTDREFMSLSIEARYLYIGLLTLFSECANKLVEDRAYIAHRLAIPESKVVLEPLYLRTENGIERGFLAVEGEDESGRSVGPVEPRPAPPKKSAQTDEEFLASLQQNPAYAHVDFTREMGKMDAWLAVNPGRRKTRQFVVKWLNKIERPIAVGAKPVQPGPCVWSVYEGMKKRPCGAPPMPGQTRSICAVHMKDREALDRRLEESKRMARSPGA